MNWLEQGYKNTWLPYTQMQWEQIPLPVKSAEGCKIILENGQQLIDGTSSWWSSCFGYKHPQLVEAITNQAQQLSHVMFAGLANKPAFTLASRLCKLTDLDKCFFSDSGSTAVEVAMKMAVQYWLNQDITSKAKFTKTKFISFNNSYHGDTMGAMSLADPNKGMHNIFKNYMPYQINVKLPDDEYSLNEFDDLLSGLNKEIAAVIIEPLMQGAGGMKFHSPDILEQIYKITKKNNLLFIADEIATGFGRTGYMFACQEAGITPDIMCLGKALTGGMLTLSATLATTEVYQKFHDQELTKCLMHGPTYMGNALACSCANTVLDIFEQDNILEKIEKIESFFNQDLPRFTQLDIVKEIRVKGAVGVIELQRDDIFFELRQDLVEHGVWLRPFGNIIYFTPPFIISKQELKQLTDSVFKVLTKKCN